MGDPDCLEARNRAHVMRLEAADDPEMLRLRQLVDEEAARERTALFILGTPVEGVHEHVDKRSLRVDIGDNARHL